MSEKPKRSSRSAGRSRQPSPAPPSRQSGEFPDRARLGPEALHAPWRLEYLEAMTERERQAPAPKSSGSFLRDFWLDPASDVANHVIARVGADGEHPGFILLNAFPYASGHLLVALGEPRPTLLDYTPQQRAALWRLTDAAAALMQAALEPQGINIGLNQGRAAGAGIPQHLHVHLVPRWAGDVNFISVVAQIRVIPSSLTVMAERYRRAWRRIKSDWT